MRKLWAFIASKYEIFDKMFEQSPRHVMYNWLYINENSGIAELGSSN